MKILNMNIATKNITRKPRVNYQTADKKILSIKKLLNNSCNFFIFIKII